GKYTGEKSPHGSSNAVCRHDIKGIVERGLDANDQSEIAWNGGDTTEEDRAHRADKTCSWCNRDETDDNRRRRSHCGGLARAHKVKERPDHQRRGGREHRRRKRETRDTVRSDRAARVEPEPPKPQQAGS